MKRTTIGGKSRLLRIDALEDRCLLAAGDVVTIGDSWAWLIAANAPGSAPAVPGFNNSFQQMLDATTPGKTVYNESFGGGLAAQHVLDLAGITARINAHPDADIVWLSTGGNDIVGGLPVGGYNTTNSAAFNAALKSRIVNDVTTIANHILSIRPDIQVVIEGYDYLNIWDTFSPVSAGDPFRVGFYGIVRADTGFPALDQILNISQNADFNNFMRDVGTGPNGKQSIADNNSRIHYIDNWGLQTSLFGTNGFLGSSSNPLLNPADLPTDVSLMNTTDPIHLNSAGYLNLALRSDQEFFGSAFQDAALATSTATLDFGNVRVGDTGASQTVTASNVGPNFTKVQNVIFPGTAGDFSGSGSASNPLFMDPTLGSDTAASAPYDFSPVARGNRSTNLTVTSDSGNQALALSGTGVGPVYSSVSTLDVGSAFAGGTTSQTIDISNITTDGDLGSLTDLTLLTATISGPDAAAFSIDSFVPFTAVAAGGIEVLSIEFDATGLSVGPKTATLIFTTDEGSSVGTFGTLVQITLTAGVDPDPTANIGGPYSGDEGALIALSGAASVGATLFEWDLDNDGLYDDATGENLNFIADDNAVFTIGLRINGDNALTDSTTVTVNNVAPTATIVGPASGVPFQPQAFTLSATDPSSADQAVGFVFDIDWNGDDIVDETVFGINGIQVVHTFQSVNAYTVKVTATDKDGGTGSVATNAINIVLVELQGGNLFWSGTSGTDTVEFEETAAQTIDVRTIQLDGVVVNLTQTFVGVTGQVIAYGGSGGDIIDAGGVDGLTTISASIVGGKGDDTITGGGAADTIRGDAEGDGSEGRDVVDGGAGDDLIYGDGVEGSDDTLSGGDGNDTIYGDNGDITTDGAEGADVINGDDGDDSLFGGRKGDTIFGGNGNDFVDGETGNDVIIDVGGPSGGNDTLIGGSGNDVISGGSGNDSITGGSGKDVLFSGVGSDILFGGNDSDLLVAGSTSFDFIEADLKAIATEWRSSNSYATRVANISGTPGGANDPVFLQSGTTAIDDSDVDTLFGDGDTDWFLLNTTGGTALDTLSDPEAGEIQTDLLP